MEATATNPGVRKHRSRSADKVSASYVPLQAKVPAEVREHFRKAADRHGISLSRYFEMLAKVDPLADGPPPQEELTTADP